MKWQSQGDQIFISLLKAEEVVPYSGWAALRPEFIDVVADLLSLDGSLSQTRPPQVEVQEQGVLIGPAIVAQLDHATATVLGLPAPTPLALDIRAQNRIDQDDFRLHLRWVRPGGQSVRFQMSGAIITTESGERRVPDPLWSMYRAAEPLTRALGKEERFEALAKLRHLWPDDPQLAVESEAYLKDLRVHYASSMSVKLNTLTPDRTEFDPILFNASSVAETEDHRLDENDDAILSPSSQSLFAKDRFRREATARPVYVLKNGEYLFIDPSLRSALGAIRQLQDAPEQERRAFILNPRKVLAEKLGPDVAEAISLEQIFVETEQFSERVAGVDVWRAPVLPWIVPSEKNKWIPEKFGLRVGDSYYAIPAENIKTVSNRLQEAAALGFETASVKGLLVPAEGAVDAPPPDVLPATQQCQDALASLLPLVSYAAEESGIEVDDEGGDLDAWDAGNNGKLFLVVRDNFDEVEFESLESAAGDFLSLSDVNAPDSVKSTLKLHQKAGLSWLANCRHAGRSGALLADDMGLGKTLQAISFMAWLRSENAGSLKSTAPFLIIAPTGLLGTWRAEIEKHLTGDVLGDIVPAFGGNLKLLKETDSLGARDIETGKASLNAANWRDASVVLTTYETLRDYHFSFARTRFGCIIYDEIQKLKNPGSQMTRAAKTLNADFTLGMTGTPVENRLQDLWSIMDVLTPGYLGASREFERRHPADDLAALGRLKESLTEPVGKKPPYMLRRMKADALSDMPAKHVHRLEMGMPTLQAEAYRNLVARAATASAAGTLGKAGILGTLANMRGISLYPDDPKEFSGDLSELANNSARIERTLFVLRDIAAKNEKALIFVEDLAMQEKLASLVQKEFSLTHRPFRINGTVPGPKRQAMVEDFQSRSNRFDVMILSPRAGGVGLTITAANHVIHLSRWWNPAVEDQATDRVFRIGQTKDVHVYLPMAVHPDGELSASSFDLRLDALISRKRDLTRDLFFPPDASQGDLGELFSEVSLEREVLHDTESARSSASDGSSKLYIGVGPLRDRGQVSPSDQKADVVEPKKTILSLPKAIAAPQNRIWRQSAGQSRPTGELLAMFEGRDVENLIIRDPYALASDSSRRAHVQFIRDFSETAKRLANVQIEYAPEANDDVGEIDARHDFGRLFSVSSNSNAPKLLLTRRSKRSRDDDFHDRFVEVYVKHAGGAIKRHEITIGRGVEALYNDRRQCTVTYVAPL